MAGLLCFETIPTSWLAGSATHLTENRHNDLQYIDDDLNTCAEKKVEPKGSRFEKSKQLPKRNHFGSLFSQCVSLRHDDK